MEIYELRAYIGKTGILYSGIFSTLDAAKKRANRLKATCGNEVALKGMISRLALEGETYELAEHVCYL